MPKLQWKTVSTHYLHATRSTQKFVPHSTGVPTSQIQKAAITPLRVSTTQMPTPSRSRHSPPPWPCITPKRSRLPTRPTRKERDDQDRSLKQARLEYWKALDLPPSDLFMCKNSASCNCTDCDTSDGDDSDFFQVSKPKPYE